MMRYTDDIKTAYIDFDGTVVDVFNRYRIILEEYLQITSTQEQQSQYREMKQHRFRDDEIAERVFGSDQFSIEEYVKQKRRKIEDIKYLKNDSLLSNTETALNNLKLAGYNIVLITQRAKQENLLWQLDYLNIRNQFNDIVALNPSDGVEGKAQYLNNKVRTSDFIVGDSPNEACCKDKLNMKAYFVKTGLWSEADVTVPVFKDLYTLSKMIVVENK